MQLEGTREVVNKILQMKGDDKLTVISEPCFHKILSTQTEKILMELSG
jgi:hypothetical protein